MKSTKDTEALIAESGLSEGEIKAEWLKMMFANAANRSGGILRDEVYYILGLSSELYPEEMLDSLKSHSWL